MLENSLFHKNPAPMSKDVFSRYSAFVQDVLGIKMPESKKTMLQGRLLKRMRAVGKETYEEYYDYVFGARGMNRELANMIDAITTNKTEFFREPNHFEYLVRTAAPELIRAGGVGVRGDLLVWSAGCSTGEEPYTLAMVLNEFAERRPGFRFSILATDICTDALQTAALGIYGHEKAEPIPMMMRRKYLLRSKDRNKNQVRIAPELRAAVRFRGLNLMKEAFGIREKKDIIFCRNVIIYFNRITQERVLNRLCRHLNPGGYLFTGHSETLSNFNAPLKAVAPTIYRKLG
ncbi:MAG: chemotaxis protein CheR [Desulfobacterales bacterium]|nr:chemotaxis protein CheR [Desulfobacterales bacterium]